MYVHVYYIYSIYVYIHMYSILYIYTYRPSVGLVSSLFPNATNKFIFKNFPKRVIYIS